MSQWLQKRLVAALDLPVRGNTVTIATASRPQGMAEITIDAEDWIVRFGKGRNVCCLVRSMREWKFIVKKRSFTVNS
jgi:hypothetical protein